jgi:hypothetical protein
LTQELTDFTLILDGKETANKECIDRWSMTPFADAAFAITRGAGRKC